MLENIVSDQFKKTVTPYGGLYMHVFQPSFNAKDLKSSPDFEETRLKKYKLSGLLTNDFGVLQQVQPDFEAGDSIVLPLALRKMENIRQLAKSMPLMISIY